MLSLSVFAMLLAVAISLPQGPFTPRPFFPRAPLTPQGYVPILDQVFDLNPIDGSYNFRYETGDGSTRQETGVINNPGTQVEALSVTGSYSYISSDGTPITVNYIADENGFQPIGNSIHPQISKSVADQVAAARAAPPLPVFLNPGRFPQGPIP